MSLNTGIYKIVNSSNGKEYIGSAVHLGRRRNLHLCQLRSGAHRNKKLQSAWDKHGEGAFKFETVLFCDRADLLFYEQIMIDGFNSVDAGYNILRVAGSGMGFKHGEDHKASLRGNKRALGMKHSEASIEAIKRSLAGNKYSLGHKHPPEFGREISARISGTTQSADHVAKRMAAHVGAKRTEQAKANMRAAWEKRRMAAA